MYQIYYPANINHPYDRRCYKNLWQAVHDAEEMREICYTPMQIIDTDTEKIVWEHWLWSEPRYIK